MAVERDGPATDARAPRVLVLAESLPYPTYKGGDLRTWQNVNALAGFARVGVFGLCSNDARRHAAPDLPLAFWRASGDPALAYPPPKGVRLAARAWLLDPAGHPSDLYFSAGAAREIADLLAEFDPRVVLVEALPLHRYLDVVRHPARRTILDCHNVEAAVARSLATTGTRSGLEGRVLRDVLPARTAAIERRATAAADQLWVCSEEDERLLRETHRPHAPIAVVPNGVRIDDYDAFPRATGRTRGGDALPRAAGRTRGGDGDDPLTLLFPGIFSYPPNAVAAAFLIDEIFPRLAAAHAACRLLLVGPMPTPGMRAAAEREPRIVVTGAVPDVRPHLAAASAMAVPLFHGGGTHLKVIEAFAARLPVISTAKGAEGLGVEAGAHLLLAERADEFVAAALALARDPALAARLTARARAVVEERFSWPAIGDRVRRAIDGLGA